ncbi:MAG: SDR family NAD(P)-dependent oxidoreductase [Pseudomonadales bacterium]
MKSVLVTGANKGIGLAVVEAILREQPQYSVILGSRDHHRGETALNALLADNDAWSGRVETLELDVGSDQSVANAHALLAQRSSGNSPPLHGLVNNAGMGTGGIAEVMNVNVHGIQRTSEAFAPLLIPGGRIVNVTSAAGPNFVAKCDSQRQDFFRVSDTNWDQLEQFMQRCQELAPEGFASLGMNSESIYGLSKACANSYTLCLARRYPELLINACTPGFIETDLGKEFLGSRTPSEAGMKSPAEGARVIVSLLFATPRGSGHYYGSDGLRSPVDRYRAPGMPEYSGSE